MALDTILQIFHRQVLQIHCCNSYYWHLQENLEQGRSQDSRRPQDVPLPHQCNGALVLEVDPETLQG